MLFLIIASFLSCQTGQQPKAGEPSDTMEQESKTEKFPKVKKLSEYEKTDFLPTLEHKIDRQKNSIYCVTLLYAWDEIRKVINQPFIISQNDEDLLLLHSSKSFIDVLKRDEYSTEIAVNGDEIIAKSKFEKSLPFETKLNSYKNKLTFKKEPVASFGVNGYAKREQLRIIEIVYYEDDNNFIIKLLPEDKNHEIILFKTEKIFNSIAEMNVEILRLTNVGKNARDDQQQYWKYGFNREDEIIIPKFLFNIETNYASLEGKTFSAATTSYLITEAWQRTAFRLEESGAEIESEARITTVECPPRVDTFPSKRMIFNNDFLILLQRTDAKNPYFGLWVANTELMIKEK